MLGMRARLKYPEVRYQESLRIQTLYECYYLQGILKFQTKAAAAPLCFGMMDLHKTDQAQVFLPIGCLTESDQIQNLNNNR